MKISADIKNDEQLSLPNRTGLFVREIQNKLAKSPKATVMS